MARLLSIPHRLYRFARIGRHRQALLLEATLCLLAARLALALVPFPRLARWLGTFVPPDDARVAERHSSGTAGHAVLAGEVGWAVTRAAGHLPIAAVCLPQAMAALVMLRRRRVPSVMHFGAGKSADKVLDAHAWLDAAGIEVTGYPVPKNLAELACFV